MNILFILLQVPEPHQGTGMYVDLALEFVRNGHNVTVIAPDNHHAKTYCRIERGMKVVRVNSKPTQGVASMTQKGIGLALLPYYFRRAYKQHLAHEPFDWLVMPTPPITLSGFVSYVKKRTQAHFYLILRDIHPQSVYSIGLLKYKFMYRYLNRAAVTGYQQAQLIGCMSKGNIEFLQSQYPNLDRRKLVVLYNWLKGEEVPAATDVREKYGLRDKFVALFGGTIGKGQRIENIVFLAEHYRQNPHIVFLLVGRGVEMQRLKDLAQQQSLGNIMFLDYLPQSDYLNLVRSVDLGLVSISERYTVPTCPSKAVAYMSLGIPIFAMINPNSDYGTIIEEAGAGYWAVGTDHTRAIQLFDKIYTDSNLRESMKERGKAFYETYCTEQVAYKTMMDQMAIDSRNN